MEAQLERLIEGAFAQFFSKTVRPHDIALQLSRAMEDGLEADRDSDGRQIAPDQYTIRLNPHMHAHLLEHRPDLCDVLSGHMIELAAYGDYRLLNTPVIRIIADPALDAADVHVTAKHSGEQKHVTAVMERIDIPQAKAPAPRNAQLIINSQQVFNLSAPIITIGRSRENHLVLDDPFTSRHHAQIRLRFGRYTIFDSSSQGGTFVNDVSIKEHSLQPGDVVRIGKTQLVYYEEEPLSDQQTGATSAFDL